MVEDERALVDARGERDRGRLDGPRDAEHRDERDGRRGRERAAGACRSSPPSSGQVRRRSGRPAWASTCMTSQAPAKKSERGPERRVQLEPAGGGHRQAELEQPERQRDPAGLVGEQPVVERRRRAARPMPTIRPASSSGHQTWSTGARTAATASGRTAAASRVSSAASQRVGHRSILCRKRRAAYFMPTSVSAAGYAHWPGTPASESVRVRSVSAGTVESGARTIQRPSVSRPCSSTSRRRSGSCSKPRRKPVAQMTCSTPSQPPPRRGSGPRAARARPARPTRGRAGRTARRTRRRSSARSAGGVAWKPASPRFVKSGRGDVQRPPRRLAPADRDDLGARRERVQPLRRGGHAGADDGDARRVRRAAR